MTGLTQTFTTAELIRDGILAIGDGYRAKNSELSQSGLPFARAGNIDGGFDFRGADRFPLYALGRVGGKISQPGDTVFTSKGTVGRFALVRDSDPPFVYSPQLSFWRPLRPEVLDPRFLFYWMHGREFWLQAAGVKGQTDMADYVSLSDQRRMRITLPPIETQRAIGVTLSSLDDKIELNREMNRTLEALAQAIFRSWFVDFDPVVAKAEGREPFGMDEDTAALFPDRFVDSELGPIPEGWEVRRMRGLTRLHRSSIRPFEFSGEVFAHYSIPAFDSGGLPVLESGGAIKSAKYALPDQCFLVSKLNPGSPRVWFPGSTTSHRRIASTEFLVITARIGATLEFLLCLNRLPDFQARLAALATGTTGSRQRVKPSAFEGMRTVVPPSPVSRRFSEIVSPMLTLAHYNLTESLTLTSLRDLLLPKLLSGEIRVPEAAEMVEEVA